MENRRLNIEWKFNIWIFLNKEKIGFTKESRKINIKVWVTFVIVLDQ